jgi:hypothetical protein
MDYVKKLEKVLAEMDQKNDKEWMDPMMDHEYLAKEVEKIGILRKAIEDIKKI